MHDQLFLSAPMMQWGTGRHHTALPALRRSAKMHTRAKHGFEMGIYGSDSVPKERVSLALSHLMAVVFTKLFILPPLIECGSVVVSTMDMTISLL